MPGSKRRSGRAMHVQWVRRPAAGRCRELGDVESSAPCGRVQDRAGVSAGGREPVGTPVIPLVFFPQTGSGLRVF